jgi:diaminohydroxyphosphoribosylaminopyrimidine deaminase/5-amino-6-(5-phosphoribosylamino)uracil reductase
LRVVLDRAGALPPSLRLFSDEHAGRTVAVVAEGVRPACAGALEAAGGCVLTVPLKGGHLDLGALLDRLGAGEGLPEGTRPVQSVLVEPGPGLATAFLAADLADRLFAFVAPKLVGGDGRPAVGPLGVAEMAEARGFVESAWETVGSDVLLRGFFRAV